ncbi:MAG: permease [Psychrobium sp.]
MILLLSILALFIGPLLFNYTSKNNKMLDLFDGFIFVVIGGLVIFHILPESIETVGLWSILFVGLGLIGPSLAEQLFHKAAAITHKSTLILGVTGLVIHSLTDGAAIVDDPNFDQLTLIIAVIAHRLPVGLTVWWLLRPHFGKGVALAVLGLMAVGTGLGSMVGEQVLPQLNQQTIALIESFIAGSVLHVVFHRPYAEHHHDESNTETHFDGLGSLLGVICLVTILMTGHEHDNVEAHQQLDLLVELALMLSPFLLAAYFLSSLTKLLFSDSHAININTERPTKSQTLRGALLGLPLPFCIPDATKAYKLLQKQGTNATMALAFLVSAPILGFESLLVSLPLLGVETTAVRLACALVIIICIALMLARFIPSQQPVKAEKQAEIANKLKHALRHGYEHLLDHTAPWLMVGLVLATLLTFGQHQAQWYDILLVAAIALPFRLCATGITPLAAAMLISGWSPGSALTLLLIGPAINIELLKFITQRHGKKLAWAFSLLLPAIVIVCSYIVDATFALSVPQLLDINHASETNLFEVFCLAVILLLISWSLLRRGARAFVAELLPKFELFSHKHHHH